MNAKTIFATQVCTVHALGQFETAKNRTFALASWNPILCRCASGAYQYRAVRWKLDANQFVI